MVLRDYGPPADGQRTLYLYDCTLQITVSQTSASFEIINAVISKNGMVWISTNKGTRQLNTEALRRGAIKDESLPSVYKSFSKLSGSVFFDNLTNCWLTDGIQTLHRSDTSGIIISYTKASGLNTAGIGSVFQDREGIIWLISNGSGAYKLMHTNLSLIEKPFGLLSQSYINSTDTSKLLHTVWC